MTVPGYYICVSDTHYTLMAQYCRVLAKEVCHPVCQKVRTLKDPACSLERRFRRPEIKFREHKLSLALVVRGDKDMGENLLVGIE